VVPSAPGPFRSDVASINVDAVAMSTYVDVMSEVADLSVAAAGADPATGLRAANALRRLAEVLEAAQVANARRQGWSWEDIAAVLGVSRQAVHRKYAKASDT
jgi:DNA-directed RNA polymerase specialized sigma24 family protein